MARRAADAMRASAPTADADTAGPSVITLALRQAGLLLLCAAWLWLGITGHDPWKSDDALTFATAWEMIQRGDWLVPYVAQIQTFDRAPLAAWLAAATLGALSPPLEPYDAARVGAAILLALVLALTAWTGRELNGRAFRWMPVLIVVGSLGLFDRSHQLSPELALMFAVALALYAFALALRRPAIGGVLLGLALALGFLAYGFLGPLWIGLCALLLPLAGARWRTGDYALTVAVAIVVALPLALAWPLGLYVRSPALFDAWRAAETLADYLAFLPGAKAPPELNLLPKNIVWFAWPALPLVVWTLWVRGRGFRGGLATPGMQVPGTMALVIVAGLIALPGPTLSQALPLLVPLALIASVEVDSLERDMSAALDWFGILTFGLTAIVLWAFWVDSYVNGMSPRVALLLRDTETGYGVSFRIGTVLPAALLTALWIVLVRPARRSNRRAILNWAAGMTLVWGLVATIWLPYIDSRRTYRLVADTIANVLPRQGCVASRDLGDPQRALFYYFRGIVTVPETMRPDHGCEALLVQYGRLEGDVPALPGWRIAWSGARRGDSIERYAVYLKERS
jgi:4-amino-4-deoxy-L-arabinose transferase-like glycosyltransferase